MEHQRMLDKKQVLSQVVRSWSDFYSTYLPNSSNQICLSKLFYNKLDKTKELLSGTKLTKGEIRNLLETIVDQNPLVISQGVTYMATLRHVLEQNYVEQKPVAKVTRSPYVVEYEQKKKELNEALAQVNYRAKEEQRDFNLVWKGWRHMVRSFKGMFPEYIQNYKFISKLRPDF